MRCHPDRHRRLHNLSRGNSKPYMTESVTRKDVSALRRKLLRWFATHERTFPWRETRYPFRLLLAEMMLQRTRAEQVVPVYEELIRVAGRPELLARLRITSLCRILRPLGLHWRVENFRDVSRELIRSYNGVLPRTREELTSLPGIGDYVAGVILAVSFRQREWVVDSNIVRVYRRYFHLTTSKEGRRDRRVVEVAKLYSKSRKPREATLALLDFAALVCKPRNAKCQSCPVRKECAATTSR